MLALADLFQDYTPPNAADYRPDALVSPKLWPGVTLGWAIAYNTQLVKNAPKTWMDLTKPEYKDKQIGQVVGPSGGTTWTRIMFERQVLGEDYWAKQAALGIALFPSGAPLPIRWCAARSRSRRCSTTSSTPRSSRARRPRRSSRPRACRSSPTPTALPSPSKSPNAAKLFMNWRLSKEGQAFQIAKLGNITSMKEPPSFPKGWDPKVIKVWVPNFDQFEKLREPWLEQWNKTYGYRQ